MQSHEVFRLKTFNEIVTFILIAANLTCFSTTKPEEMTNANCLELVLKHISNKGHGQW